MTLMRMLRPLVAVLTLTATASTLAAQSASSCATVSADACQKAEDLFTYLFPQLGGALAAGNPTLGSGDALGGLGHFSLGVRATALRGSLPDVERISISETGRQRDDIPVTDQWVPVPTVDAAIGLYRGLWLGFTRVGAVDALVSAMYIPSVDAEGAEFSVDGNLKLGFGARIGLIEEALILPSVTLSVLQRGFPTVTFIGDTDEGARLGVQDLSVDVTSWRLMATKRFLVLAFSLGYGGDKMESGGRLVARAPTVPVSQTVSLDRSETRRVLFANATLDLRFAALAAEIGRSSGGSLQTYNRFDPSADAGRTFASVGLRVGF
jgi:hypothetical protein